jgi:hypothetical protein
MLAAAGKRHTEAFFQPGGALSEVACGKNEMIRQCHGYPEAIRTSFAIVTMTLRSSA